jgi:hypothetical protein
MASAYLCEALRRYRSDLRHEARQAGRHVGLAEHPVAECAHGIRGYNQPLVGRLTLNDESLRVPDAPGQRLNFITAQPGTQSADRLNRLAVI